VSEAQQQQRKADPTLDAHLTLTCTHWCAAQALKPSNSNARLIQHSAHAAAGDKQMADLGGVSICVCV